MYSNFFEILLKGNKSAGLKILTGILRTETSNLYNGFDNIAEYKLMKGEFVDFYGFNEKKMNELLSRPFIREYNLGGNLRKNTMAT